MAESKTAAGQQYSIYDWFRELHDGQEQLNRRVQAIEDSLKLTPPPAENEMLTAAAVILSRLGINERGYPDAEALAWLEQYRRFYTKEG